MARPSAPRSDALLLTCEHGGNRVPAAFAAVFAGAERELAGHRGWDVGALWLARRLARRLRVPLVASTTTRLLVDLNRSAHHPRLFSRRVRRALDAGAREAILREHYRPYRRDVERRVATVAARGGRLLHVSVHSFTPRLAGRTRRTDVGLLYDPRRPGERALCAAWQALLREDLPALRVRRNDPYRGDADGLTTALRRRFDATTYRGVELEVNQRLLARPGPERRALADAIATTLARLR